MIFESKGYFVLFIIIELEDINEFYEEVFGLVLYVISFKVEEIDQIIDQINQIGFGFILGVYSCIN